MSVSRGDWALFVELYVEGEAKSPGIFDWCLWNFVYGAYAPGLLVVLLVNLPLLGLQKRE